MHARRVGLEVGRLRKGLAAQAARERGRGRAPSLVVDAHVGAQRGGLREAQAARAAGEGPLARMDAHVGLELVGAREGLGAQGAAVGALARVDLHVAAQRGGQGEVLAAHVAREGPLARVGAQVVAHGRRLEEALAAHVAHEGPLPRVDAQVPLEVVGAQELLLAHVALVRAVRAVRLPVRPQAAAGGVRLAAQLALVRRLGGQAAGGQVLPRVQPQLFLVLPQVSPQGAGQREGPVTNAAHRAVLQPVHQLVPLQRRQVQEVPRAEGAPVGAAPLVEAGVPPRTQSGLLVRAAMPQVEDAVNADALKGREEAAADVTLVLPGGQVRGAGVLQNVGRREEALPAVVAVVQGLQRGHNLVLAQLQAGAEVAPAAVALEGELAWVLHRQVAPQGFGNGKAFAALKAAVRPGARVYEEMPEEDGGIGGRVQAQRAEVAFVLVTIELITRGRWEHQAAQVLHCTLGRARVPQLSPDVYEKKILQVRIEMWFHLVVHLSATL